MDSLLHPVREENGLPQWFLITMILSAFFIVWSNLIPIIGVLKIKQLRKNVANYFILSLAVSDMMTGLLVIPFGVFHEVEYVHANRQMPSSWINKNGRIFCDFLQGVINLQSYSFVWHMFLIACDRYYRITQPIQYKRWMSPSRALAIILLLYFLATLVAFFFFYR